VFPKLFSTENLKPENKLMESQIKIKSSYEKVMAQAFSTAYQIKIYKTF